jgi:putative aldouronate transport system substrate-binding protein
MHSLYAEGLIDLEVATNDSASATNRFVNSFDKNAGGAKAAVYACSLWTVPAIVTGLETKGINTTGELTNELAYLRALKENADDAEKVYRSSGYTYITAIPYYMAENAGYALDWMNSKIKDTETDDNFRQIVLGQEGVHWSFTSEGDYMPINPAFAEKDQASYYMTGSNETKYTAYWLARVRKQPELFRAWSELMEDADEVGVYNVADFTPPLGDYNKYRSSVEEYAQNQFYVMLKEGTGSLNNVLAQLNGNQGCSKATADINNWYQNVYTK